MKKSQITKALKCLDGSASLINELWELTRDQADDIKGLDAELRTTHGELTEASVRLVEVEKDRDTWIKRHIDACSGLEEATAENARLKTRLVGVENERETQKSVNTKLSSELIAIARQQEALAAARDEYKAECMSWRKRARIAIGELDDVATYTVTTTAE